MGLVVQFGEHVAPSSFLDSQSYLVVDVDWDVAALDADLSDVT